ncbi:hypothetical protein OQ483_24565 (plasmid) [Enterobacter bugandensis]|uniref:scabin-related ADP-ribosyltransferase n=1 Tax=Enterobacter bugandensis TaxID=881260 RepID=UPI00283A9B51|nr:hypothetical protein [Enterobacter bugandensis]WMU75286.1 hypothetical protein OQ483_24565 [Enterobacter bugandensis]
MPQKKLLLIPVLLSIMPAAYAWDTSGYYPDCKDNIDFTRASEKEPELIWRTDQNVLWRGDTRNEGLDAFKNGMIPKGIANGYTDAERDHDWRCHKADSFRSVFVSTSTKKEVAIEALEWTKPQGEGWVYEIYAPGGINQELSIGKPADTGEAEISFAGGVKGKFIKQACFYKKKQLQHCEDNPNFIEPSWKESPENVAAAQVNLKRVVPKASCDTTEPSSSTPEKLCQLPDMATTKYFQEGSKIVKEGMHINYDVSDRGSEKPERWIMLMTGEKKSDLSHIAAKVPVTASMPDKGSVYISPDMLSSPDYPWQKIFQRWSLGISHAENSYQIDGPASFMHTSYLPENGDVLLYEMTSSVMTPEEAESGFKIVVRGLADRDTWLFTQVKDPETGRWGTFGGYQKIKAGEEKNVTIKIIKQWHPDGGIFRVGLSESVNNPSEVKPVGNTPYVEVTRKKLYTQ